MGKYVLTIKDPLDGKEYILGGHNYTPTDISVSSLTPEVLSKAIQELKEKMKGR